MGLNEQLALRRKQPMKIISIILIVFISMSQFADASVRRIVKVSYETQYGYSDEYKMEVTFLTGQELNKATKTYDYDMFDNYILIWFKEDKVAILKIDDIIIRVNQKFDSDDFKRAFQIISEKYATQVNSQYKRKWKIEAKDIIRWIDPRVE